MSLVVPENLAQANGVSTSKEAMHELPSMSQLLDQWLTPTPKFEWVSERSHNRSEVEQYIGQKFDSSYGAKLAHYLPLLLTLRCGQNLSASAGMSLGSETPKFFLEQYLDSPIESELDQLCGENICRDKLVATSRGASRLMFIVLASVLRQAGFDWMVFTATKPLLHSLRKLGFETIVISEAKPARLDTESNADWGSYYDNQPQVVAGRLSNAQEIVQGRNLFNLTQGFYRNKIESLAQQIGRRGAPDGTTERRAQA
jgi:hypothetical protein